MQMTQKQGAGREREETEDVTSASLDSREGHLRQQHLVRRPATFQSERAASPRRSTSTEINKRKVTGGYTVKSKDTKVKERIPEQPEAADRHPAREPSRPTTSRTTAARGRWEKSFKTRREKNPLTGLSRINSIFQK